MKNGGIIKWIFNFPLEKFSSVLVGCIQTSDQLQLIQWLDCPLLGYVWFGIGPCWALFC